MWNEEKQIQLLEAQELVQQLERERDNHTEYIVEKFVNKLIELDENNDLYYNDVYTYVRFLVKNKQKIIKLLEDIK